MEKHNDIDEGLLVKYLLNESSESERKRVEEWVSASTENKKHLEHFRLIWEQSATNPIKKNIHEDEAWLRMKMRLKQGESIQPSKPFHRLKFAWQAAAILVIALCTGWLGYIVVDYFSTANLVTMQVASINRVIRDTLPDGSTVTINKNSFLTYPSAFTGNTREVTLNGEAYFDIAPDKKHPFIIHANDVAVRVVGTSFNIKTINGKTEVIVESGVVEVIKEKKSIRLQPKEKTVTNWDNSALVKDSITSKLYNYYHSKEFICNATPLYQLVETLNLAYNAKIEIANDSLKQVQITTVFKNESLDTIIGIISETFKIKVERKGNSSILLY